MLKSFKKLLESHFGFGKTKKGGG
jgi:hypothetical protein